MICWMHPVCDCAERALARKPRPDQLDYQVSVAVNEVRRNANDARQRLNLRPVDYLTETAETIYLRDGWEAAPSPPL